MDYKRIERAAAAIFKECGQGQPAVMVAATPEEWVHLVKRAWLIRCLGDGRITYLVSAFGVIGFSAASYLSVALGKLAQVETGGQAVMAAMAWMCGLSSAACFLTGVLSFLRRKRHRRLWNARLAGLAADTKVTLEQPSAVVVCKRGRDLVAAYIPACLHRHVYCRLMVRDYATVVHFGAGTVQLPSDMPVANLGFLALATPTGGQEDAFLFAVQAMCASAQEAIVIGNLVVAYPGRSGDQSGPMAPTESNLMDLFLPGWRPVAPATRKPELV